MDMAAATGNRDIQPHSLTIIAAALDVRYHRSLYRILSAVDRW